MKIRMRAVLGSLLLVAGGALAADKAPYEYEQIKDVAGLGKKEIVAQTNAFIAETFKSGKTVTEMSDADAGKIIGNVILIDPAAGILSPFKGFQATMTVDAKDGKYRLRFTNVTAVDQKLQPSGFGKVEGANNYRLQPIADRVFPEFGAKYDAYIRKAKTDDNW